MKLSEEIEAMAWAFGDEHRTGQVRNLAIRVGLLESELEELRAPVVSIPAGAELPPVKPGRIEAVPDNLRARLAELVRQLLWESHQNKLDRDAESCGFGRGLRLAAARIAELLGPCEKEEAMEPALQVAPPGAAAEAVKRARNERDALRRGMQNIARMLSDTAASSDQMGLDRQAIVLRGFEREVRKLLEMRDERAEAVERDGG